MDTVNLFIFAMALQHSLGCVLKPYEINMMIMIFIHFLIGFAVKPYSLWNYNLSIEGISFNFGRFSSMRILESYFD